MEPRKVKKNNIMNITLKRVVILLPGLFAEKSAGETWSEVKRVISREISGCQNSHSTPDDASIVIYMTIENKEPGLFAEKSTDGTWSEGKRVISR